MTLAQIAVLFQISGFILAGVFAAILLEKGVTVKLSSYLENLLELKSQNIFTNFPPPAKNAIIVACIMVLMSAFTALSFAATIISCLVNNWWGILISGLLLFNFVLGIPFIFVVFDKLPSDNITLVSIFKVIACIQPSDLLKKIRWYWPGLLIVIPMLLFTAFIHLLRITFKALAEQDTLKKGMLVLGTIILLTGFILEFISTL